MIVGACALQNLTLFGKSKLKGIRNRSLGYISTASLVEKACFLGLWLSLMRAKAGAVARSSPYHNK